nr:MAG TPA: Baseplate protein [Caudoviricetes sp.]
MRRFYFQNSAGEKWPLNGERGVYLTEPQGLGATLSPVFADLQYGFFEPVADAAEPQSTVTGTLVFVRPTPYQTYRQLLQWIGTEVTICYVPTPGTTYYRDLSINYVQKGELTELGWLECPFSFFATGPWYVGDVSTLRIGSDSSDGTPKRYDYAYEADLRYGSDAVYSLSGTIYNRGQLPGVVDLVYTGAVINPRIRLIGEVTGRVYGLCSAEASLVDTDTLHYTNDYRSAVLQRIPADGVVEDLLDTLDLSTDPFSRLPVSEPVVIEMVSDTALTGQASVKVYSYWRTV